MTRARRAAYDLALTEGANGKPLMHRADCPDARRDAAQGKPVMTLFACEGPLPSDVPRHECLEVSPWSV